MSYHPSGVYVFALMMFSPYQVWTIALAALIAAALTLMVME